MPRATFDIVIEAVRYTSDGKIEVARAFERRGFAFSDHVLLSRQTLIDKLANGKKCVTGKRKEFLAGSFETDKTVQLIGGFISTAQIATRDNLENVPIF